MRDDNFARKLDEALAGYAAVEPRDGLEQRILANLRAQHMIATQFVWRRWTAAGFVAAIIAVLLIWFGARRPTNVAPAPAQQEAANVLRKPLSAGANNLQASAALLSVPRSHSEVATVPKISRRDHAIGTAALNHAAALPKLAQFPAPEPLTAQEKLLIEFVEEDPQGAVLVAEATAERLQKETDQMKGLNSNAPAEQEEP